MLCLKQKLIQRSHKACSMRSTDWMTQCFFWLYNLWLLEYISRKQFWEQSLIGKTRIQMLQEGFFFSNLDDIKKQKSEFLSVLDFSLYIQVQTYIVWSEYLCDTCNVFLLWWFDCWTCFAKTETDFKGLFRRKYFKRT